MSEKANVFPTAVADQRIGAGADPAESRAKSGGAERAPDLKSVETAPARPARVRARPAKPKIVHLELPPQERVEKSRKTWWISKIVPISAALCVAVPTLCASIYYGLIAADQFATEARFAVRSSDAQVADVLGVMTGMPSTTVISDSYILADFITSREMVKELEERLPLRDIYSREQGDFLTRLDPTISLEELAEYWDDRVDAVYDSVKNTMTIEVKSFTPEDSALIAQAVVEICRELINNLSAQARRDAVKFAASEVVRAEARVRTVRTEMLKFRTANNELDPTQSAAATLGIASQLDAERSQLRSQLAALSTYLSADAPSVQMLRSRIEALDAESAKVQGQISAVDGEMSSASSGALANVVGEYQEILLNQEFAEKAYAAAQASLERARAEADRQQSYLAIFVPPDAAEAALYPDRLFGTFAVLVLSALAWALGALVFLTVRDHIA